jgi:hypothetical protein
MNNLLHGELSHISVGYSSDAQIIPKGCMQNSVTIPIVSPFYL